MTICQQTDKLIGQNISKAFGGKPVLADVTVSLRAGEIVCLLGESGVGKTTLFNILAGLLAPDAGRVFLDGADVTGHAGKVGYMQQKDLLLPYKTMLDNVTLPLCFAGQSKEAARQAAGALFPLFGLSGCEGLYPNALSGGMRQRAALLRTTFMNRETLLMDEPFSALDAVTKQGLHLWFLRVCAEMGLSAFIITHDVDEAVFLADRIYILNGESARIGAETVINRQGMAREAFRQCPLFQETRKQIMEQLIR